MRVGKVIGTVTLNRSLPSFKAASLKVVVPQSLTNLARDAEQRGDFVVAWDEMSAGEGDLVALSEGAEAAQPFRPDLKPVDAYASAILDSLEIDPNQLKR